MGRIEDQGRGIGIFASDLNYLSTAENRLIEEFACALYIGRKEVVDHIEKQLRETGMQVETR